MAANVIALRKSIVREQFELTTSADACVIMQQEMAELMRTQEGRIVFYRLAAVTGLSPQTIRRICYGETHWPRLETSIKLLKALGYRVLAAR